MIKKFLLGLLAFASAAALLFKGRAASERARAEKRRAVQAEVAREYERAGSEALVSGIERENEAEHARVDTDRRDHFE